MAGRTTATERYILTGGSKETGEIMDVKRIHFIREIMVTDYRGGSIPTMQFSYDNASYLNPTFVSASTNDVAPLRELYTRLSGSRREGGPDGTTVIIPNRSWYSSLWGISADEVKTVPNTDSKA